MRRLNLKRSTRHAQMKYHLHAPEYKKFLTMPRTVDLRSLDVPIFNQGEEGSCTAHGWCGLLDFIQMKQLRANIPLGQSPELFALKYSPTSRQFFYYNERLLNGDVNSDDGAEISDGPDALQKYGICEESLWPYIAKDEFTMPTPNCYAEAANHKVFNEYQVISLDDIKQSLVNGYPVVIGLFLTNNQLESMEQPRIITKPNPGYEIVGGHCVEIIGYDDNNDYVIVRNSWGSSVGTNGYFYLDYDCVTDSNIMDDARTIRV